MANGPKSRIDWRREKEKAGVLWKRRDGEGGGGEEESKVPKAHFCWSAKGSKSLGDNLGRCPQTFRVTLASDSPYNPLCLRTAMAASTARYGRLQGYGCEGT